MYSQNNEETIITQYFNGKVGRFLDIGAYDGKTFSNTLRLAELGWTGVCVEASPINFVRLYELHKNNPKIELLNAAISASDKYGVTDWYDSNGDGLSTMSKAHRDRWAASDKVPYNRFKLPFMPVMAIFEQYQWNFDFVNIDIESANWDVFQVIPWEWLTDTKFVCIEHDRHHDQMFARLEPLGYKVAGFNGENILLAR